MLGCGSWIYADDLSDGISEYVDDTVSSNDNIGSNKDNNINFVVVDAIGKAKTAKKDEANGVSNKREITNIVDKSTDNNENSIVVEAGSNVDKVTNIVIEK